MALNVKTGMIVCSTAGRDRGKFMVITEVLDGFALIADGKERKLVKPKKKRIKHLYFTNTVVNIDNLTDKSLRVLLREFNGCDTHNA